MFMVLLIACNDDLNVKPPDAGSASASTSPLPTTVTTTSSAGTSTTTTSTATNTNVQTPSAAPVATASVSSLDPHSGMSAVSIGDDGVLLCDANDPELAKLHQARVWLTTPRTEAGAELFVAQPVYPGKAQNGQAGKCVDSNGNVVFADHLRWTTSRTFAAPAAPPADSPWFDESRWGSKAKGKSTELVALAADFRVLCFDEAGARCNPAEYEPKKPAAVADVITISVPKGTKIDVKSGS